MTPRSMPPSARTARGRVDGTGRPSSRSGEQVSDDLRLGHSPFLANRRRIATLSLASTTSFAVVAAYQMGILRHLPEPPLAALDADRVLDGGAGEQAPSSQWSVDSALVTAEACVRRQAALISPTWENAWGKLPSSVPS